jgi:hypothetical protein
MQLALLLVQLVLQLLLLVKNSVLLDNGFVCLLNLGIFIFIFII